jgi:hypothetical protein
VCFFLFKKKVLKKLLILVDVYIWYYIFLNLQINKIQIKPVMIAFILSIRFPFNLVHIRCLPRR